MEKRSQQVMLMGKFYQQASIVLGWIGGEKEDSQRVVIILERLAAKCQFPVAIEEYGQEDLTSLQVTVDEDIVNEVAKGIPGNSGHPYWTLFLENLGGVGDCTHDRSNTVMRELPDTLEDIFHARNMIAKRSLTAVMQSRAC
jgi:hypothetical protein